MLTRTVQRSCSCGSCKDDAVQRAEGEPAAPPENSLTALAAAGDISGMLDQLVGGGDETAASFSNPDCPTAFCSPIPGGSLVASALRDRAAPVLLAGIAAAVNPRVVPLWNRYLFGGSAAQDLSSTFGSDFTQSPTTRQVTERLMVALGDKLTKSPPPFPPGQNEMTVPLDTLIGTELGQLEDETTGFLMKFNVVNDIAGNLTGGIGKDQLTHPIGARPSPFDDSRSGTGFATLRRQPDGAIDVSVNLQYEVRDTVDLCPGDCGTSKEQIATVPMSRFEATGVSGDVPYTIGFPAPTDLLSFRVLGATPPPAPPAPPTPTAGFHGTVTASMLHVRSGPSTSDAIVGRLPRGTAVDVVEQVNGETIEGNPLWDRLADGTFVSDRFIQHTS